MGLCNEKCIIKPIKGLNNCDQTIRSGGISRLVFAQCGLIFEDIKNAAEWCNYIDRGKLFITASLAGQKQKGSPTKKRTDSCMPERVVGWERSITFQDFNADNFNFDDFSFYNILQENYNYYKFGFITCDGLFYGFYDNFTIEVDLIQEGEKNGSSFWEGIISWNEFDNKEPIFIPLLDKVAIGQCNYDTIPPPPNYICPDDNVIVYRYAASGDEIVAPFFHSASYQWYKDGEPIENTGPVKNMLIPPILEVGHQYFVIISRPNCDDLVSNTILYQMNVSQDPDAFAEICAPLQRPSTATDYYIGNDPFTFDNTPTLSLGYGDEGQFIAESSRIFQWYRGTVSGDVPMPGGRHTTFYDVLDSTEYYNVIHQKVNCRRAEKSADIQIIKNPGTGNMGDGPNLILALGNGFYTYASLNTGPVTLYLATAGTSGTNLPVGATFQWYRDGLPIPGANSFSYVATTPGVYQLRYERDSYEVISNNITIGMTPACSAPRWLQYTNTVINHGTVSIGAIFFHGASYQWYKNNVPIPGANSSGLFNITEPGVYHVEFRRADCGTPTSFTHISEKVIVTVTPTMPDLTIYGTVLRAPISVTLYTNTTYQWQYSNDGGNTWSDLPDGDMSFYNPNIAGLYRVQVTRLGLPTLTSPSILIS